MSNLSNSDTTLFARLKDRKLVQWALAYGAVAWLVLQVLDVIATPWGLSDDVVRVTQAALVVGFFIVLVLAWYHGVQGRQRVSGPELLMIAGILLIAGLLSTLYFAPRDRIVEELVATVTESTAAPDSTRPSIAVLPLTNMSGEDSDRYFTDGIHEEILTRLAQMEGMRVISRTSVMGYRAPEQNLREIAQELGVDYIGEGSVRRAEDRVLITIQLIDAGVDEHLWAETYERELAPAQIFEIQRDVAQRIAASMKTRLTPREEARISSVPTEDLEAYDLYLRGREGLQRGTLEGLELAIGYFDQAIERDPLYAPAYASNARAWAMQSNLTLPPLVAMPEVKAAARRAIELDPNLAEAHTWMGFAHAQFDWDWPAAERELLTALELNGNSAEALWVYVSYLELQGEFDQAHTYLERLRNVDPSSILHRIWFGFAWNYYFDHKFDEAIAEGTQDREIFRNVPAAHLALGLALAETGRFEEAVEVFEEASSLDDSPLYQAFLAWGLAEAGRESEARELLTQVEEISEARYICKYEIAVVHVALRDPDAAFEWLDRGFDDRAGCMSFLKVDPRLDAVREDPRYAEALRRAGFTSSASITGTQEPSRLAPTAD